MFTSVKPGSHVGPKITSKMSADNRNTSGVDSPPGIKKTEENITKSIKKQRTYRENNFHPNNPSDQDENG